MKIVIAPDSFKECLSAIEVCAAIARGIRLATADGDIVEVPMADGGEGTIAALKAALPGQPCAIATTGPLGAAITAEFWLTDSGTAVIETSAACGLPLIPTDKRDPRLTSTRGVGDLILAALDQGASKLMLTVGGSGTVDGGAGLARALGYRFLDENDRELGEGGGFLNGLAKIIPPLEQPWAGMSVEVLCDVTNPLLGASGAAPTFAPQKGATPVAVEQLETGLERLAMICKRDLNRDITHQVGGGAAGGMAAGLTAFLDAVLASGVEAVAEQVGLAQALEDADLAFTGEGRTDCQTAHGKVCAGVARLAKESGVPCILLSGSVSPGVELSLDVTAAISISRGPQELADAMTGAADDLCAAALAVLQMFLAGKGGQRTEDEDQSRQ